MNLSVSDNLISYYFLLGLQQNEILLFLLKNHNIQVSKRSLKRHLKRLRLYRNKNYTNIERVISFLESHIQISGQLHGYKWMHLKCIQSGLRVQQNTVRLLLQLLDPIGVSIRRKRRLRRRQYSNRGPNYLWHIDSYDKLKPYGICINGCIDGFSRKIIWLKASYTSNNPKVIAGYFIKSVKQLKGCPRTVRTDMGTENMYLENMQIYFHQVSEMNISNPPFIYGTSQANQRIEAWWSMLRKHHSQFWMNLFQMLKDDGYFNGTFLDKSLIQYCFMDIIQVELNSVVQEWNTHFIRKSRNSISPSGRPIVMYSLPELYDCEDYIINIEEENIYHCEEECLFLKDPCDEDVFKLCEFLLMEMDYIKTGDPYDALNLYISLRRQILSSL